MANQKYKNTCGCPKSDGEPCGRPSGWGTDHVGEGFCRLHDGKDLEKAKVAEVQRIISEFGGRTDIHPAQALLELVQFKAAEVEYWRAQAANAHWKDLADVGIGGAVYKKVTLAMLHEAEDQLQRFSQACIKVGVDEVRVRVMATQGEAIVAAMRKLLADPRLGILPSAPTDAIIKDVLQELAAQVSPNAAIARWKS